MAFERIESPGGVAWLRSPLLHRAGVPHGFSTRRGGVSPAPFDSLNLGLADAPGEPDAWERVQENWSRFLCAVGLVGRVLVRARQVHGVGVLEPDRDESVVRPQPPFADGDALVSVDRNHAVSVRMADCAAVLLADPTRGVVGAVHAGWRGTVAGVLPRAIAVMAARGARVGAMLAAVGPCIGPDAFEVGPEVCEAFGAAGLAACVRSGRSEGRWLADLPAALRAQLIGSGVAADRIDIDGSCTLGDPKTQFSYRRDGSRSGRMAAIIGLSMLSHADCM